MEGDNADDAGARTPDTNLQIHQQEPNDEQSPAISNEVLPLSAAVVEDQKQQPPPPPSDKQPEGPIRFQLIPISDVPDRPAFGEVIERKIDEGQMIRIGRQVVRDGQPTIKGNKPATEIDVWFCSKVVSRLHAEIWVRDQQLYIKDIGSSSGTFLNKLRLSPANKESRPYPIREGDVIQFGVDYKGKVDSKVDGEMYRCIVLKFGFFDQSWLKGHKKTANGARFTSALKTLLAATNPYASKGAAEDDTTATDCCICIGEIAPYQALFIAPCSHCYHYKCVSSLLMRSPMFQCPLCRQVANLTASVSTDSLYGRVEGASGLPANEFRGSAHSAKEVGADATTGLAGHVSDRLRAHATVQAHVVTDQSNEGVPVTAGEGGAGQAAEAVVPSAELTEIARHGRPSNRSSGFASGMFSGRRASQNQQQIGHESGASAQGGSNNDDGRRRRSISSHAEQLAEIFRFGNRRNIVENSHSPRRRSADVAHDPPLNEIPNENGADAEADTPTANPSIQATESKIKRRTLSMKIGAFLKMNAVEPSQQPPQISISPVAQRQQEPALVQGQQQQQSPSQAWSEIDGQNSPIQQQQQPLPSSPVHLAPLEVQISNESTSL